MSEHLFEMKLILSKGAHQGTDAVSCGRYKLRPIPTTTANGEVVLSFVNNWESEKGGSHPEEEASIVSKIISLSANARVKPAGIRINYMDIKPMPDRERINYPRFYGKADVSKLGLHIEKFISLSDDLARQFSRAASAYSTSLDFIPSDPTFAFFLLVVSIECMSSQDAIISNGELDMGRKKCERFCRFVRTFLPRDQWVDDGLDEPLLKELLKTVYYSHRSGFVHGGEEVSAAALLADNAHSSYFKHLVNGKEIRTPGLAWFSSAVRGSLLGYLESLPMTSQPDQYRIARLAFEKACLQLKSKYPTERGQIITLDDIDFK